MTMNDNREKIFLTAGEISRYLRIPLNTIYRLTKRGIVKGVKVGKQWRYNKRDFEKYLSGETDSRSIPAERYKERRSYPRMNCNFKCISRIDIQGRKDIQPVSGTITNISSGGVFIRDNNTGEINIGDPIDINFDLVSDIDKTTHNMYVKGRVVRKTYSGIGIKFRQIKEDYKELINKFVD